MSVTDLVMYAGNDRTFRMTLTDDGEAIDLTDATVRFTAKQKLSDDDIDAVISLTTPDEVAIVTAAEGVVDVNIPRAATEDFTRQRRLVWDIQITNADDETRTAPEPSTAGNRLGTLLIRLPVTRETP